MVARGAELCNWQSARAWGLAAFSQAVAVNIACRILVAGGGCTEGLLTYLIVFAGEAEACLKGRRWPADVRSEYHSLQRPA